MKKKKSYKNNKFKISPRRWAEKFELPDGSHSVSDIQDYFESIIKKYETLTDNSPIKIYANKIENRIAFRIKAGYYLELFTSKTMKSPRSSKSKIIKDGNGENVLHLDGPL